MKEYLKDLPLPLWEEHPEYQEFYLKAWELAHDHIKEVAGLPQTPYMDEAFCDTQIWIWDTCFMTLFCKYAPKIFPGVESLRNFYDVLYGGRTMPMIVPTEREPAWTHKPQGIPTEMQIHLADNPPLFAWAEYENALMIGDPDHLRRLLYRDRPLQKHYEWLENLKEKTKPSCVHASTYWVAEEYGYRWEGGRSGMDNTPRGRTGDHATAPRPQNPHQLWLDAICQQALSAQMIAKLFGLLKDTENEKIWRARFAEKQSVINELYWDAEDEFYYDIHCDTHAHMKVMSIASYWALTAEVATPERAAALAKLIDDPATFGGPVPFPSLSRSDNDYCAEGCYWRGSVWLPTAYAALRGLKNYGYHKQNHRAACKLLEHMYRTYQEVEPHTIWECYAPEQPRPATTEHGAGTQVRKDFCGWSALGPIAVYIEFVLGFHTVNAFTRTVEWALPETAGRIGIRNLRFGDVVTDIEACNGTCTVVSNRAYTLIINGTSHKINPGENRIKGV